MHKAGPANDLSMRLTIYFLEMASTKLGLTKSLPSRVRQGQPLQQLQDQS